MRIALFLIFLLALSGCHSGISDEKKSNPDPLQPVPETGPNNKFPVFEGRPVGPDSNIINASSKKIAVLYNSVADFPGPKDSLIHFMTECMQCEPVQAFKDHLVFAKQLEVFIDKTIYHDTKLDVPVGSRFIHQLASYERKTKKFEFQAGKGELRFTEPFCMNADTYKLILHYKSGDIIINNIFDARFFEYDLDKNGVTEQYILSSRNCSQELTVFKIE
ncbi:MAG TPA: hypothetical protein VFI06_08580 [Chitinophagaceae bacterium]|nr:hypothetical protein [Chitinophagaceae bacterium]